MSLEERDGTLDLVDDRGILLSGNRLSYSKWFEGDRPTQDSVGRKVRVLLDIGTKCSFVKRIMNIGEKSVGWKPPEPGKKGFFGGGGGRRFSPEELDLKKEEGVRIARSVAIDRAISMVEKEIPIEKIADLALAVENYLLKGTLPRSAKEPMPEVPPKKGADAPPGASQPASAPSVHSPSSPTPAPTKGSASGSPSKPKRLAASAVNNLFNEALRGGLVEDWPDYLDKMERVLKVRIQNPYTVSALQFSQVEAVLRSKLGKESAA